LARQAAADALEAITVRLDALRGQGTFSSWVCKFAVSGVAAPGRRIWPTRALSLDLEDWDRLSLGHANAQNGTSLSTRGCSKRAASCRPVWQLTGQILDAFRGTLARYVRMDDLLAANPGDAGCGVAFYLLDCYVEAELNGTGPESRFPAVAAHLRCCQTCHQDYQGCWPPWEGLRARRVCAATGVRMPSAGEGCGL
jgi:hypothetical protein